ncbi:MULTISPECIES: dTMP kinase [unclassified Roseateles]|uniref:dTMP kinase n=1 Tax=unclassified Roseateles TaxID=2626991 RepID=UPI0006FFE378|nr:MULTISPECIES: dTMP kinase [unclassified Roseateles]KQW43359.1 thymidylate kinase [Pelomonas sp. Root405]KRA71097.1 thymidylate kinase [Pelomonas sp. Root662]
MTGRFISFEGIDGAGKSTHIQAVADWFRARGADVQLSREPGGTPLAETLRDIVLKQPMDSLTELLLMFAGRRDHVEAVIKPALAAGKTLLCDRFTDASFAYQGGGRGLPLSVLNPLADWVQEGTEPELTLWFDLPAEQAAARRASAREADRIEQLDLAFFERVRAGYAARAAQAPARIVRVDASGTVEQVAAQVLAVLDKRYPAC